MKKIKALVDCIEEELEGAQHYAETYVELKAEDRSDWAKKFHNMAEDELHHAEINHDYAVTEIQKLREVFHPTADMEEKWDKAHVYYVDRASWIKKMLDM